MIYLKVKEIEEDKTMQDYIGFIPLALFTIIAIMYHVGHNEYKKGKRAKP
jgi:hypothetical protein